MPKKRTLRDKAMHYERKRIEALSLKIDGLNRRIAKGDKNAEKQKQKLIADNPLLREILEEQKKRHELLKANPSDSFSRSYKAKSWWPYGNPTKG